MLKILNLASFLTTFCTLVFISSSFAAEPPLSKFVIKRLQTIVSEQGYEVSVNGKLDAKTNELIREIFKKKFPDKNFSYQIFLSLKKQTKVRDKNLNFDKFVSRNQSRKNAAKKASSEEDRLIRNLLISYASIAKNNKKPDLASEIPDIRFLGPSSVPNSDVQFLTEKYGKKLTDILTSATENSDVNALMILVKLYSIMSNRKKLDGTTRLPLIARWTAQAAKAGDLQSIVNLGHIVDSGRGVVASRFKALKIYQYARDQGFKGAILKLDKVNAKKKLEREKIEKRELALRASGDAPPTTKAVTQLVTNEVVRQLCTQNNYIRGAAQSGSIWNMITALSPDTIRIVNAYDYVNQCDMRSLAGTFTIRVIKVIKTGCSVARGGYDCRLGFSIKLYGPDGTADFIFDKLLGISNLIQPATASFSVQEGKFYPYWTISNFKMLGG